MSLGTTYSPTVPVGGAASYKLMAIEKCTDVFKGFFFVWMGRGGVEGRIYVGGFFHVFYFVFFIIFMGEENFNKGGAGLSSII